MTATSLAVACPRIVPLLKRLTFTYGTVAEYSVGLVMLIFTSKRSVDLVVSKIRRDPILGAKSSSLPPEIAG